jgi:tRNA G10  N-methylase Trm11
LPRDEPPELDMKSWKEFTERYGVFTDSLWLLGERDDSGAHSDLHHGGFIPQLPRQAILRFTKRFDTVLDGFAGYGTTLIECRRWGRHGVGVELDKKIHRIGLSRVEREPNRYGVKTLLVQEDSRTVDFTRLLKESGLKRSALAVLHPPYHDIIKYGEGEDNLCNAPSLEAFVEGYGRVVENIRGALKPKGYLELVIGDKYERGEWVPLGFHLMRETMDRGFKLKSICVKNIENTMAKRSQINLWKYRA